MAKKTSVPKVSPGLRKIRSTPGLSVKLAKHLDITKQAVSGWDKVPITRLFEVEAFTKISREDLRPDIFRHK